MNLLPQRLARPFLWHELPGWGWIYKHLVGDWRQDARWADAPTRIVRGKLHHYEMELNLSHWSERFTYFIGRHYGLETQLLLMAVLRPGDHFIDVGANIGMVTLLASRLVGPQGIVDSIEPNPRCAHRIRSLIERNHITNIHIHGMALSDANGRLALKVPKYNSGEGTLAGVKDTFGAPDNVETFDVDVRIGDEILSSDSKPPILIKIDVEGFEHHVLSGLSHLLATHKPIVISEMNASHLKKAGYAPADLFTLMDRSGYAGYAPLLALKRLHHVLRLGPVDQANPPNDVVWVPKDGEAESVKRIRGIRLD